MKRKLSKFLQRCTTDIRPNWDQIKGYLKREVSAANGKRKSEWVTPTFFLHIYVTSNLEWKGLGKKLYLGLPPPHTFKTKKNEEKIKLNLIAMPF